MKAEVKIYREDLTKISDPFKRGIAENRGDIYVEICTESNDIIMLDNLFATKQFTVNNINNELSKGDYRIYNRNDLEEFKRQTDIPSYLNLVQSIEITIDDCFVNDNSKRVDLKKSLKNITVFDKNGNKVVL